MDGLLERDVKDKAEMSRKVDGCYSVFMLPLLALCFGVHVTPFHDAVRCVHVMQNSHSPAYKISDSRVSSGYSPFFPQLS